MGKHNEKKGYKLLALKLLHLLLSVVLFYACWLLFRYNRMFDIKGIGFRYNIYAAFGYGALLYCLNRTYNAFLLGYFRIRELVFRQFISQLISIVITYCTISVAWSRFRPGWAFLPMLMAQLALDIVWSYGATKIYFKLTSQRRTILIYRNEQDKRRFGSIHGKPTERLYKIVDELQYDGSFTELYEKIRNYDAVFVAGVNSRCRNGILKYCQENSIPGFFLPHIGDMIMQEAEHVKAFDSPVLYVNRKVLNPEYAIVKRGFDLVSSGIGLLVLSPIMLVTGLAIHLYDGGPALYRQVRLTKDGREFEILKFRSMRVDAEKDGVARLSTGENDNRITPIGRFVRKVRLDELPQLINIFKGDMSVVGPRPERPEIAKQYYESMPDFRLRLQVKAGLTGYAQVYGKYNTEPYEKLEFDLLYINQMSLLTDLQICFATVAILFSKESTQGVAQGKVTALDVPEEDTREENEERPAQ